MRLAEKLVRDPPAADDRDMAYPSDPPLDMRLASVVPEVEALLEALGDGITLKWRVWTAPDQRDAPIPARASPIRVLAQSPTSFAVRSRRARAASSSRSRLSAP